MTKEHKDRINKRKIAFVYLMHRMFEGSPAMLIKVMTIPKLTIEDLQAWDAEYKEAVYQTIQEEDARGVQLKDPLPTPSIKVIKDKILRRLDAIVSANEDPSRLSQSYKILSEFEGTDEKKEKGVLDAINESIKPLPGRPAKKKDEMKTMVDKMREEGLVSEAGRKPGRPKKKVEPDPVPEEETQEE